MEERRAHRLTDRRARRRNETSGELGCVSVCGVGGEEVEERVS